MMMQAGPNLQQPPDQTMMVEPAAMLIASCDADGDARVTATELTACVARSFQAIDTTHAGSIGYIQYGDWAERYLGDRNALPSPFEVDGDHDDRITLAELQADLARIFARLDTDHDGAVTRAECLTIRAMPAADGRLGHHRRR
ncbi:EF-hand domain-containing protein [Sphingomonas koreensis]|nr:EF-hand domain-containing protein [Sphingomonas koreensis]